MMAYSGSQLFLDNSNSDSMSERDGSLPSTFSRSPMDAFSELMPRLRSLGLVLCSLTMHRIRGKR
jgi:hypothetical protein